MQLSGLFLKSQAGCPVEPRSQLRLVAGQGISGDVSAKPGSPRQVLIQDQLTLTKFGLQPGELRENILLDRGLATFESGQSLQIGAVVIRLMFRCEPCAFLESLQPGLASRLKRERGWLGMVVQGGAIALTDSVQRVHSGFPAVSDVAKERFYQFVATIPSGKVVTTQDVILALGVTSAHYRTLPGLIKRAPNALPVHRIVARDRTLLTQHLPQQADHLQSEGVEILNGQVQLHNCWLPQYFHAHTPLKT